MATASINGLMATATREVSRRASSTATVTKPSQMATATRVFMRTGSLKGRASISGAAALISKEHSKMD